MAGVCSIHLNATHGVARVYSKLLCVSVTNGLARVCVILLNATNGVAWVCDILLDANMLWLVSMSYYWVPAKCLARFCAIPMQMLWLGSMPYY